VNDIWLVTACPQAHADRLAHLAASLDHDPDRTVVVTSRHHDRLHPDHVARAWYWTDNGADFNLARLWNHGLRLAYEAGATEVAVLSTDVTGTPDSLTRLRDSMRTNGCVMAGPSFRQDSAVFADTDRTTHRRVPGGCYMLAAEHQLLCDTAYRWWYSDDDLETQARQIGPVGIFAGTGLEMGPDSALTDERAVWAVEDRAHYVAKWGREPW